MPPIPKKAKTKTRPKKTHARRPVDIARKLDALADAHGISPQHLSRFPEMLSRAGIAPETVSQGLLHAAYERGREAMEAIQSRVRKLNERL